METNETGRNGTRLGAIRRKQASALSCAGGKIAGADVSGIGVKNMDTPCRESTIAFLSKMAGGELAALIQEALDRHPDTKLQDDGDCQHRVVLSEIFWCRETDDRDDLGLPEVYAIGLANPKEYGPEWERGGDPFLQMGDCKKCGLKVASHVKSSICPACGTPVYLS
jgi:hypothetical protein